MKEFMLIIRNQGDSKASFSAEKNEKFLKACETYIDHLSKEGKLVAAQPMDRQGQLIAGKKGDWRSSSVDPSREIIVGYYHVMANDLDDAISIAKNNPEFEYGNTASIEVRPIKMKEETTGFTYPSATVAG